MAGRPAPGAALYANAPVSDRLLRIGYVSPDFRSHSVACFIEPLFMAHDRNGVEVFCYADVSNPDDVTERLRSSSDHWRSICGRNDAETAALIKQDTIDILVDLAGHTAGNRLPVFARRPAPVQVTWLGYPNTTGLAAIDYRITDAVADPPGEADRLSSEKLIRLEHGFLCYRPEECAPDVGELPCLEQPFITFGSCNNLAKVGPGVVRAWAAILHAVPGSRLLLKSRQLADEATGKRYLEKFAELGIPADRILLYPRLAQKRAHLALYNRIDIGLDPFPYNGTTTTCEALWMGVPVITLAGDRHAGRVGASILYRIGMEELAAASVAGYIELARSLAHDKDRLTEMRLGLRQRMQGSDLMDRHLFAQILEQAYTDIWQQWLQGRPGNVPQVAGQ